MFVVTMTPAGCCDPEFEPIEVDDARTALSTLVEQVRHDAPGYPIGQLTVADIADGYRLTVAGVEYRIDRPAPDADGVRLRLPTGGYVIVAESRCDTDTEPIRSQTFIDVAGRMDDEAALAHVRAELASLMQGAPCNVVHTWRLVHRGPGGERELLAPEPVRGAGAPAPDRDA